MRKYIFFVFTLIISCTSNQNKSGNTKKESVIDSSIQKLKKYSSVKEMIDSTFDYTEEDGTFKVISEKPKLHIQLAKHEIANELEANVIQQVKRNIIYVGFRIFAQTDIDEIQITSLPLKWDISLNKPLGYMDEYKETVVLTRNNAKSILQKYYGFEDFSKLFGEKVGDVFMSDIANSDLRKMMFNDQGEPTLDKTFEELKK